MPAPSLTEPAPGKGRRDELPGRRSRQESASTWQSVLCQHVTVEMWLNSGRCRAVNVNNAECRCGNNDDVMAAVLASSRPAWGALFAMRTSRQRLAGCRQKQPDAALAQRSLARPEPACLLTYTNCCKYAGFGMCYTEKAPKAWQRRGTQKRRNTYNQPNRPMCYTEKAAPTRHRPERQHNERANRRKQCSPNETKPIGPCVVVCGAFA